MSEDGRYLIVTVSIGTDPNNLMYYVDLAQLNYTIKGAHILHVAFETYLTLSETPKLIPIVDTFIASYDFIDNDGEVFLLMTDKDASNYKVISVNISQGIDKVSKSVVSNK